MRIRPITDRSQIPDAVRAAANDLTAQWYVTRVAKAMGATDLLPGAWQIDADKVTSFREIPADELDAEMSEEDKARHATVVRLTDSLAETVDDYVADNINEEDLHAVAASLANLAEREDVTDQFETVATTMMGDLLENDIVNDALVASLTAAFKGVRKVKTTAGAKKYGAPIGTPIVRDASTGRLRAATKIELKDDGDSSKTDSPAKTSTPSTSAPDAKAPVAKLNDDKSSDEYGVAQFKQTIAKLDSNRLKNLGKLIEEKEKVAQPHEKAWLAKQRTILNAETARRDTGNTDVPGDNRSPRFSGNTKYPSHAEAQAAVGNANETSRPKSTTPTDSSKPSFTAKLKELDDKSLDELKTNVTANTVRGSDAAKARAKTHLDLINAETDRRVGAKNTAEAVQKAATDKAKPAAGPTAAEKEADRREAAKSVAEAIQKAAAEKSVIGKTDNSIKIPANPTDAQKAAIKERAQAIQKAAANQPPNDPLKSGTLFGQKLNASQLAELQKHKDLQDKGGFKTGKQTKLGTVNHKAKGQDPERFTPKTTLADGHTQKVGDKVVDADGNTGTITKTYQTHAAVKWDGGSTKSVSNGKLNHAGGGDSAPKSTVAPQNATKNDGNDQIRKNMKVVLDDPRASMDVKTEAIRQLQKIGDIASPTADKSSDRMKLDAYASINETSASLTRFSDKELQEGLASAAEKLPGHWSRQSGALDAKSKTQVRKTHNMITAEIERRKAGGVQNTSTPRPRTKTPGGAVTQTELSGINFSSYTTAAGVQSLVDDLKSRVDSTTNASTKARLQGVITAGEKYIDNAKKREGEKTKLNVQSVDPNASAEKRVADLNDANLDAFAKLALQTVRNAKSPATKKKAQDQLDVALKELTKRKPASKSAEAKATDVAPGDLSNDQIDDRIGDLKNKRGLLPIGDKRREAIDKQIEAFEAAKKGRSSSKNKDVARIDDKIGDLQYALNVLGSNGDRALSAKYHAQIAQLQKERRDIQSGKA